MWSQRMLKATLASTHPCIDASGRNNVYCTHDDGLKSRRWVAREMWGRGRANAKRVFILRGSFVFICLRGWIQVASSGHSALANTCMNASRSRFAISWDPRDSTIRIDFYGHEDTALGTSRPSNWWTISIVTFTPCFTALIGIMENATTHFLSRSNDSGPCFFTGWSEVEIWNPRLPIIRLRRILSQVSPHHQAHRWLICSLSLYFVYSF